jgi:hypothetical protein
LSDRFVRIFGHYGDDPVTKAEIVKPIAVTNANESSIVESVKQLNATLTAIQEEISNTDQVRTADARLTACEAEVKSSRGSKSKKRAAPEQ